MEKPKKDALLAWFNFFGREISQDIAPVDTLTKLGYRHVPTLVAFLKQNEEGSVVKLTAVDAAPPDAYSEAVEFLDSVLVAPLTASLLQPAHAADGDEFEVAKILLLLLHELRLSKADKYTFHAALSFEVQLELAHMLSYIVNEVDQWPEDEDSWSIILFEPSTEFRRQYEAERSVVAEASARASGVTTTPKQQRRAQPMDGSFTAPLPQHLSASNSRRRGSHDTSGTGSSGSPLLDSYNSPTVMNMRALRSKEREIKKLKEDLAELRYCKEEAEIKAEDLQRKLTANMITCDEKVAELRRKIDRDARVVEQVQMLEPECARLTTEVQALRQKVSELKRQLLEAKESAEDARQELLQREHSFRTRLSSVHEYNKQHDDLRAEIATLRQQLFTATQESANEAGRAHQKELELDLLRSEHAQVIESLREEYNSKLEMADDNYASELRKTADLEARLAELRASRDAHTASTSELKQKILVLQTNNAQLTTDLERLQTQRDELDTQRQLLEADFAAELSKSATLEGRLTEMRSNRDALTRSQGEWKQKIASLKSDKARLSAEVDRLQADRSDLDSKIQILEAELAAEKRKCGDLEVRLDEMRGSREAAVQAATDVKQQMIDLRKDSAQLTTSLALTEAELATLKDEHAALLEHMVDLDSTVEGQLSRATQLERDLVARTVENDRLSDALRSAEVQKQASATESQVLKTELANQQSRMHALETDLQQLQAKHDSKVKAVDLLQESVQRLSDSVESLSAQNAFSNVQFEKLLTELDEARSALKEQMEKNDELVAQHVTKDALISELNEARLALKEQTDKNDELVAQHVAKDALISELNAKITAASDEQAFEQRSADLFKSPKYVFNDGVSSTVSSVNSGAPADYFGSDLKMRLSFTSIDGRRLTQNSCFGTTAQIFADEGENEGDVLESTMVAVDESVFVVVPDTMPPTPRAVVPIDVNETFKRPSSAFSVSLHKNRRRRSKSVDDTLNSDRLKVLNGRNIQQQPHLRSMYSTETMSLGEKDLPETDFRDKENFVPPDPVKSVKPRILNQSRNSPESTSSMLSMPSPSRKASLKQRTKQFFGKISRPKEKHPESPASASMLANEKRTHGGAKFDVQFLTPKTGKKTASKANESITSRSPLLPFNSSASNAGGNRR